ncbi:MAG TPA: FAD-dependent monooxygenase [Pyrinomonadaceae bacterium]|nr:FAD-dependent monooxygenase [Pyrinomonadaceae bacterium]
MIIAIVGGGIGGLTTALALKQSGFDSEVFEQAPALHDVGAAIAIWPNAMRILERLNLADRILAKSGVMKEIRWVDQNGWLVNRVSIPEASPAVALHRADLQHILVQALPPSSIHLAHTLVNHSQQRDKVVATFANGRSIEADLLIGADGIHSHVREQFLNDGDPVYRGYIVWRGISPTTPSSIPPNTAIEIHGRGKRFGIGPVGLGRTGWWASANLKLDDAHEELTRLFAGWYPPVLELIEATPATSILTTPAFDRLANRRWGNGRMTLLGDAIHPTTPNLGQGGCLAMEDAMVLARCFEKYGATEEALRKYEHRRYQRTTMISSYSRYYGSIGQWENLWARGLRRAALALAPEPLAHRLMQVVFDYDPTTVTLPN